MPDLQAMREDPAVFAGEARGKRLAAWQEEDVRAVPGSAVNAWTWGRQTGKSERLADLALWFAFRRPNALALVLSGGGQLGARPVLGIARRVAAS
jgi:hypothetical protein